MSGTVAVFGSINMDITAFVERSPAPGETVLGHDLIRNGGGKGANQAVAAARAGNAHTFMIGALGRDSDGQNLRASLAEAGVSTQHIEHVDGPSGTALITVADTAENSIVVVPGANALVDAPTPEAQRVLNSAQVILAQLEVPPQAVAAAAQHRGPHTTFVLNAAPAIPLPEELWKHIDILVVNEHEALIMAQSPPGTPMSQTIERLLTKVPQVLVTLGSAGSQLHGRTHEPLHVPALPVTAVDTTAAGDTFCGVFAAELAHGETTLTAMQRASSAAALAVQHKGAQASVPHRAATLTLWDQHFGGR
ncbi:ribokinase [Timonella sp. A28]|uniref:ribokinase n=1 Tax=Timonella sp. A28 TaxID=3442640 RepID=UPI003EB9271D